MRAWRRALCVAFCTWPILCTQGWAAQRPKANAQKLRDPDITRNRREGLNAPDESGLKGLRAIDAVKIISDVPAETEGLQTAIELRFRSAGLRIEPSGCCFFVLSVKSTKYHDVSGSWVPLKVDANFHQWAVLTRNGGDVFASTWHIGGVCCANVGSRNKDIEDAASEVVDEFLNEYLKWNPKPQ